jgi:hypothetical protein
MIQHTFNIKVNTPDEITEQDIINGFCDTYHFDPDGDETKNKFFKRKVGEHIMEAHKTSRKKSKDKVVKEELDLEFQDITIE